MHMVPHNCPCCPMPLHAHGAAQLSGTIMMSGYHDGKMATHFSYSLADNLFSRIVHGGDWLSVYLFLVPTLPLPYLSSHAYFYKVNPNKRCPAALHFSIECISGLLALANPAITCPPPGQMQFNFAGRAPSTQAMCVLVNVCACVCVCVCVCVCL